MKAANVNGMELHHDIQSPVDVPYNYALRAGSSLTSISGDRGSPNGHRISMHNLGAAAQRVVIHAPIDPAGTPTNFRIQTAGWQPNRSAPIWFEFSAPVGGSQEMHFHVGNGGTQLTVQSMNADVQLDIGMFTPASDPAANPISATRSQIAVAANQVVRFGPTNWQRDGLSTAGVRREVLPAFGSGQVLSTTTI